MTIDLQTTAIGAALVSERLSWQDIWKPLQNAKLAQRPYEKTGNYMHFAYDPERDQFCVGTILSPDGEVWLDEDEFKRQVGKLSRGGPLC